MFDAKLFCGDLADGFEQTLAFVHICNRKLVQNRNTTNFLPLTRRPPRIYISTLCDVEGDRGSIVVYNQQFESQRLCNLASWMPHFSGRISKIQRRLWDLLPVMRDHVYHPPFAGSYSLKSVLPALVPEMTYEGMEVADGQAAGLAWESLVSGNLNEIDREKIRTALVKYCCQDTLGMVKLLEVMKQQVEL